MKCRLTYKAGHLPAPRRRRRCRRPVDDVPRQLAPVSRCRERLLQLVVRILEPYIADNVVLVVVGSELLAENMIFDRYPDRNLSFVVVLILRC